ncbi:MAG TPA: hypothetical protein VE715_03380, partial [Blastocatellia bacterium]|nr:hypothetical protein [Blastocatellia bacterium]
MLRRLSHIVRPMGAIAALLLLLTTGFGQLQPAPASINPTVSDGGNTAPTSAALPPEIMELRREGHEALYNLDSATAVEKFEEIRRRAPYHPAGDLYLATVLWLGHLNKTRRLQSGLY